MHEMQNFLFKADIKPQRKHDMRKKFEVPVEWHPLQH